MNDWEKKNNISPGTTGHHRVDHALIEKRLAEYEGIKDSILSVVKEPSGETTLCAYIIPHHFDSLHMIDLVQLRGFLSAHLPGHMIPDHFVILETFPVNTEGKIDVQRLPRPERAGQEEYVPPGDAIQEKLVKIWSEVLNLEKKKIGIDSDYFDLGGHSLNAIRMLGRIEKEWEVKLDMEDILTITTIRGLSNIIKEKL
jgi:acyl carrier protein